jgi:hypothetical protein
MENFWESETKDFIPNGTCKSNVEYNRYYIILMCNTLSEITRLKDHVKEGKIIL